MAKRQPKPKAEQQSERPQFTGLDLEEDEEASSPIPDEDGWVRLQSQEPAKKGCRRGKGKDKPAR